MNYLCIYWLITVMNLYLFHWVFVLLSRIFHIYVCDRIMARGNRTEAGEAIMQLHVDGRLSHLRP